MHGAARRGRECDCSEQRDAELRDEIRMLRVELRADIQRVDDRVMLLVTRLIPEPTTSGWAPPKATAT